MKAKLILDDTAPVVGRSAYAEGLLLDAPAVSEGRSRAINLLAKPCMNCDGESRYLEDGWCPSCRNQYHAVHMIDPDEPYPWRHQGGEYDWLIAELAKRRKK